MNDIKELFIGSLIGGAIGDALGYTVEFMYLDEIKSKFGEQGIIDLQVDRVIKKALISDDTQMTLFTVDGLFWATDSFSKNAIGSYAEHGIYKSYLRWYYTQTCRMPSRKDKAWLEHQPYEKQDSILNYKELFTQRAPGNSCLSALGSCKMGTIEDHINNSKGCGGVMRVAPVGLFLHREPEVAFKVGAEASAITHGHPTGYLCAGAFATIIAELINGKSILDSITTSIKVLKSYPGHLETLNAINNAIELSSSDDSIETALSKIGQGWIGEEALAIALYCALKEKDFRKALIMSVNHDGDSDSTGAICGNILGACYGLSAMPEEWIEKLELKDLVIEMGSKLYDVSCKTFGSN